MFGIGKLLGNVAGGLLDKIGLGGIAPFVKMGLNALTGNWLGVAQDVFGLVSSFKGNFLDKASSFPPLGGFEQPRSFAPTGRPLDGNRFSDLFRGLSNLFRGFGALSGGGETGGFGKIFSAFRLLNEAFGNNQLYTNRLSISQYTNIQA
jgi:hypothetical protein